MPTRDDFLTSLRADIAATVAACREGGLADEVEACPGWTLEDLLVHTGGIFSFVTGVLAHRDGPHGRERGPQDGTPVIDWFENTAHTLVDSLTATGDDEPCWNWAGAEQTGAFWVRRMAQEAAIHRFDAELAATGTAAAIDEAIAVDGIDEFVDVFLPRMDATPPAELVGRSIHLHAADGAGEWLIQVTADGAVTTREHAKGDVALAGSAQDLLLSAWGRVEPEEVGVEIFGDSEIWASFRAAAAV